MVWINYINFSYHARGDLGANRLARLGTPQDASMEIWSPPLGLNLLLQTDLTGVFF